MKKVILINFLIITIIIVFLEAIIRLLGNVGLQGYDKNIFFKENNIVLSVPNKVFTVFGKKSKTDENGFVVPLNNFSYDMSKKFYLILGDSVTYGVGVEEEDSFVGILRKKNKNLLNTAISGHNLESYLYILKKNNAKFKNNIEKIVIFLCLNDAVSHQGVVLKEKLNKSNSKENFFENYVKNDLVLRANIFLRERSYLYVYIKSIFSNPIERHYNYMNKLYDNEENLIKFKNNLIQINKFSKKNNLKLNFVLLPYAHQIRNNCEKKFIKPQNEINKMFNSLNLNLNDYTNRFCEKFNKNDLFLSYDPVHLSKYGHKYVSELLINDKIF